MDCFDDCNVSAAKEVKMANGRRNFSAKLDPTFDRAWLKAANLRSSLSLPSIICHQWYSSAYLDESLFDLHLTDTSLIA